MDLGADAEVEVGDRLRGVDESLDGRLLAGSAQRFREYPADQVALERDEARLLRREVARQELPVAADAGLRWCSADMMRCRRPIRSAKFSLGPKYSPSAVRATGLRGARRARSNPAAPKPATSASRWGWRVAEGVEIRGDEQRSLLAWVGTVV